MASLGDIVWLHTYYHIHNRPTCIIYISNTNGIFYIELIK